MGYTSEGDQERNLTYVRLILVLTMGYTSLGDINLLVGKNASCDTPLP